MKNQIDEKVLKYIPKPLQAHVIACGKWKDTYATYTCYEVIFDDEYNDEHGETTGFIAHNVAELKWACKKILEGRRGEIF
jgi:hypothetical protein